MIRSFLQRYMRPAKRGRDFPQPDLRGQTADAPAPDRVDWSVPPLPEEALCLVGDLHGRLDLLERLLGLRAREFPQARLVFLGDLIDRGPDSWAVLQRLMALGRDEGAISLMGNHEAMFLDFIKNPARSGGSWLKHGGFETVQSLGQDFARGGNWRTPEELEALREAVLQAMGAEAVDWLRNLPSHWQSGTLVAVHAGADPALGFGDQTPKVLNWGHPDFGRVSRSDGLWVAHGHVVVERAFIHKGTIALDTGAYATGRLSFALIDPALPSYERISLAQVVINPVY